MNYRLKWWWKGRGFKKKIIINHSLTSSLTRKSRSMAGAPPGGLHGLCRAAARWPHWPKASQPAPGLVLATPEPSLLPAPLPQGVSVSPRGTRAAWAPQRQDLCMGQGAREAAGQAGPLGAVPQPCSGWEHTQVRLGWATSQLRAGPRMKPMGWEVKSCHHLSRRHRPLEM